MFSAEASIYHEWTGRAKPNKRHVSNKSVTIMSMLAHSVGTVMQGNSHVVRELRKA